MSRILSILRLVTGGALLAVAAYGTVGVFAGFNTTNSGDLITAAVGGAATLLAIKTSVLAA